VSDPRDRTGHSIVQPSLFNVTVPLADRDEVFLLNTFTDTQIVVSRDVVELIDRIGRPVFDPHAATPDERQAIDLLHGHGFLVESRDQERAAVRASFEEFREDTSQLRVTVLTTLQCNFACDYCVQGDHGDAASQQRMTPDTVERTLRWIDARLDALTPRSFALTFFGGEPLLNLPAVYGLAEGAWSACRMRGVRMLVNVITNGLQLTPEVVDRLQPCGLNGIKVTLDGARELHDRQRPLRGGQGTFDRIVENVRRVAGRCRIAIGGNFEEGSHEQFVQLLEYLAAQDFAPLLDKVTFKPVIRPRPAAHGAVIPLAAVRKGGAALAASDHAPPRLSSPCDTCHFADDQMVALREATVARGFRTVDGVHMGPCELHRRHSYTIGPDGSLYACPGFASEADQAVGSILGPHEERFARAALRFERLSPWRQACGDCSFVPVCGGGCSVASHVEQGTLESPSCHKPSFEAGVATLARHASAAISQSPAA
jgi:uncharacterized protein